VIEVEGKNGEIKSRDGNRGGGEFAPWAMGEWTPLTPKNLYYDALSTSFKPHFYTFKPTFDTFNPGFEPA